MASLYNMLYAIHAKTLSTPTTKKSRHTHDRKLSCVHALQDLTQHFIANRWWLLSANPTTLDEVGHDCSQNWCLLNVFA